MARPFVSCVTPTYNRAKFLPYLIYQFNYQTYPTNRRELIIIDDSPTSNEQLVKDLNTDNNIRYVYLSEKINLGKKRNMLNELAKGDIIVAFDDDDYYPPEKVSFLVSRMERYKAMVSGSSCLYVFFVDIGKIYSFGPYGPGHSTNGTLAFRKEYANTHKYEDEAKQAEEKVFLDQFKGQVLQLDPFKVILCISHAGNTFDKHKLISSPNPMVKETKLTLRNFVKDKKLLDFYTQLSKEAIIQKEEKDSVERQLEMLNVMNDKSTKNIPYKGIRPVSELLKV